MQITSLLLSSLISLITTFLFIFGINSERKEDYNKNKKNKNKKREKILIPLFSFIAGGIVTFLNTLVEFFAYRFRLYKIVGAFPILETPLSFFISWWLLGYSFCILFFMIFRRSKTAGFMLIPSAVFIGVGIDFLAWKNSVLMILEKGKWIFNFMVWLILVPTTVIIFTALLKIFGISLRRDEKRM